MPGLQASRVCVWGKPPPRCSCPYLFREPGGSPGPWSRGAWPQVGESRELTAYTKPAFFWSCRRSHTNSRYRRRTHEVLAVKALLLVCKNRNKSTE